jgi:hypothetical protein
MQMRGIAAGVKRSRKKSKRKAGTEMLKVALHGGEVKRNLGVHVRRLSKLSSRQLFSAGPRRNGLFENDTGG